METQSNDDMKKDNPVPANKELKGGEEREHDINGKTIVKERSAAEENKDQGDNGPQNDALNYKNDRENGAYNPKNI